MGPPYQYVTVTTKNIINEPKKYIFYHVYEKLEIFAQFYDKYASLIVTNHLDFGTTRGG